MLSRYIYVQVRVNRFAVRDCGNPGGPPLQGEANFSHPRMLLGDFDAALVCLKPLIEALRGSVFFAPFTGILIHPLEKLEDGLAPVEKRALMELAEQAGAAEVVFWTGPSLTDPEVVGKLKGK